MLLGLSIRVQLVVMSDRTIFLESNRRRQRAHSTILAALSDDNDVIWKLLLLAVAKILR
jgi:hypothetical protein